MSFRFVHLILLLGVCNAIEQDANQAEFVGWGGESFDPQSVFGASYHSRPVKLSDKPLAYVWKNFLSHDEAKHIANTAAPLLRHSLVGENMNADEVRSSYGMFIPRFQDKIIADVETRVSNWTGLPTVYQEDMQVLRYSPGQRYKPHMDAYSRMATVLIYLTDTNDGGETAFPATTDESWADISLKPEGLSPGCAEGHVAVKPEVGTALLFYSMAPGAEHNESLRTVDNFSLHTGCPPHEGAIKWTATIWIHFEPFRPATFSTLPKRPVVDPALCQDVGNVTCRVWKGQGHCEATKLYMVGDDTTFGHCGATCGRCTPCAAGDTACRAAHRRQLGYLEDLSAELERLFPST